MAVLKRGMEGPEVEALQERLTRLGFDAPGRFGAATETAVIEFQKAHGLMPDGIAGPITHAALDRAEQPGAPAPDEGEEGIEVETGLRLSSDRYFPELQFKDLIVLHHTAGASAESTFHHWQNTPSRIATAYIVERDGTILEVFSPQHWAFHIGAGIRSLEKRSIGIEIASEGGLTEDGDDLLAFGRRFRGEAFDHGTPWRDFRFFAAYTSPQMESVNRLVRHLLVNFAIPAQTPADHLTFSEDLRTFQGVVGHHHLRSDKSDVHPGFDWDTLGDVCELVAV